MKGALFSINKKISEKDLLKILERGLYSVWQSLKDGTSEWNQSQAGTFADYLTLSPGDKVFFFRDRKIYGIGELKAINEKGTGNPALLNYPDSDSPIPKNPTEKNAILTGSNWKQCRIVFPFVSGPILFKKGIDMDEVLSSPFANFFWGLRFWRGFSFRLLGEEETRILCEILLRRFNPDTDKLEQGSTEKQFIQALTKKFHGTFSAQNLVSRNPESYLKKGMFKIENWLHALIIEHLKNNETNKLLYDPHRRNVFREVPASPPKPPMWADRIDILTTSSHSMKNEVTAKYTVIEIKKDIVDTPNPEDFNQKVMQVTKYVDFIARNYTEGNYGAIQAFYIAHSFSDDFKKFFCESKKAMIKENSEIAPITRVYVLDPHETKPVKIWNTFKLVEYSWNKERKELDLHFTKIP